MPDNLANKIAAGEVVQRPASAVKELMENALDAGAEHIAVLVKGAGSDLIQVSDDGCGMGEEDAVVSFQRHATSKIRSLEDLETILTLGFRGEALASIAAIAQVTLTTSRKHDDHGTKVVINGGDLESVQPIAASAGTSVAVRNLFFNVPARRNFLKRPATELKHIIDTVQVMALSNPRVAFRLVHESNELIDVPSGRDLSQTEALARRLSNLLSLTTPSELIFVEESTSYLTVTGLLGRPDDHRRTRGQQFLFVNTRFVKHRYLEHAVLSAYEYLLPEGAYPLFVLFLDIDPRHVDVNVHPTKAEVKFDDEQGVYGMIRTITRKALRTAEMTPDFLSAMPAAGIALDLGGKEATSSGGSTRSSYETSRTPRHAAEPDQGDWMAAGVQSERLYDAGRLIASDTAGERIATDRPDASEDLLWQLHDTYVLTQIRSGLVIIDQQAAHERILYETARRSLEAGFGLSQQLLFPKTMDFTPGDYTLLEELMPDLKSLGFDIDLQGNRSVVIRGVPADIRAGDDRSILDSMLDQYKSFESIDNLTGKENLARSIARKSAVRAGTRLSHKEMRALIDQLFSCKMPYSSPDGRPTIVKLSVDELRKRFGQGS